MSPANVHHRRHLFLAGLVLLVAVLLRAWDLDLKPPHFDEGINGGFTDRMLAQGGYHYDPTNYHGPLHFYLLLLSQSICGHNIEALRLPSVLAGAAVVAVALFGFRRHLGAGAALWLGAFLAVSPAMVFVSRYAIHEMSMLLFLMLTTLGFMDHWSGRRGAWLICLGAAGMILTKETYVIHLACLGLAWLVWRGLRSVAPDTEPPCETPAGDRGRQFAAPLAVAVATVLFFYSAGLTHPEGVTGLWRTFAAWTQTGLEHGGHAKPWHYWLGLMWRYEWIALAGFALSARFLVAGSKSVRIAVIAGAGTLAAYSLISYKTPWCIVVILWAGSLALACLLDQLGRRKRIAAAAIGLVLAGHDAWACLRLNWRDYDHEREPYVYVQTSREIERFTGVLRRSAEQDPLNRNRAGVIVAAAPFPLPWMLRDHPRLTYLGPEQPLTTAVTTADFLLVQASRRAETEALLADDFFVVDLILRHGHEPMTAYFRARRHDASMLSGPVQKRRFPVPRPTTEEEVAR
ncbi:MAG: flippase activity-associated protein Agl23 [Verrucomicrobiota bacterium]